VDDPGLSSAPSKTDFTRFYRRVSLLEFFLWRRIWPCRWGNPYRGRGELTSAFDDGSVQGSIARIRDRGTARLRNLANKVFLDCRIFTQCNICV